MVIIPRFEQGNGYNTNFLRTFATSFESDKELRCRCTFPSKDLLLVDESPENAPFRSLLAFKLTLFNTRSPEQRVQTTFPAACIVLDLSLSNQKRSRPASKVIYLP